MYRPAATLIFLTAAVAASDPALADTDGCARDYYGRIHCLPGASPGVPYYGPSGYYGRGAYRGYYGRGYAPGNRFADTDGCGRDYYGRIHCLPGASPGVPYYGPRYHDYRW